VALLILHQGIPPAHPLSRPQLRKAGESRPFTPSPTM
jgi:hypothetical protein